MADAQKAESTPSPDTEGVRLADELTSAIRIGVEDDVTIPFDLSVRIHAFLRTAQNTGRDEVLEEAEVERIARSFASWAHQTTGKWKSDGSPPPTWDQIAHIYQDYYCEIVRRVYAALSSPPVSTVDEEGRGQ